MRANDMLHFGVYSVIGTITLMPLLVLPAMVGVLVDDAGLTESFAGWIASVNFVGGALVALLMAFRIHRLNLRRIATIALTLAVLADVASAYSVAPNALFLTVRFAAGFATGAAYTTAVSAFARHKDVERGFGLFVTLQFVVSGIGLYVLPVYSEAIGVKGMYLMFAGLDLLALLFVGMLPGKATAQSGSSTERVSERTILLATVTVLAMLAYGLFEAANTAQFTYIERYGVDIGLSDQKIGLVLMIASIIGIPGAFTIVLIGHRFGHLAPLTFGITVAATGLLLLLTTNSYHWYFAAGCCLGFSWAFCLPYIQSLLASLDRNGSAIAAGSAIATLGGAVGPGMAALVVGDSNYQRVFMLSIALFAIAITCFVVADRKSHYQPVEVKP